MPKPPIPNTFSIVKLSMMLPVSSAAARPVAAVGDPLSPFLAVNILVEFGSKLSTSLIPQACTD